ncbi:MAG: hypothetical protein OXH64_01610 [Rhodospirillaceae bacterium]|nr:hypothetical protein [Rhodospirillaceae bacterium]
MTAPSVAEIKALVGARFDLTAADLESSCRVQALVRPRFIAMWLCRQLTGLTLREIAQQFGGRDHSSAHHACRTVANGLTWGRPEWSPAGDLLEIASARVSPVPAEGPATAISLAAHERRLDGALKLAALAQAEVAALRAAVRRLERQLERFRQREAQRRPRMVVPAALKNPDPWPTDIGGRFDA